MQIDHEYFLGFAQTFIGDSSETLKRKVCPACRGDRRIIESMGDPGANDWRQCEIVCDGCGEAVTDELPPNEIRTRVVIQL